MRWRFNGDTCCSCEVPTLNCCLGSLLTHAPVNYLESFLSGRQDSGGTWHDQQLVSSPIQFFSSDVDWITGAEDYDIFSPCAGSQCQYDFSQTPSLIQTGSGEWDTTTRYGVWDSLHSPPRNNNVIGTSTGLIIDTDFRLLIPDSAEIDGCSPDLLVQLNVGNPNHPDYYKRQLPPSIPAYLSGLTWGYGTSYPFMGELTFRFPLYQNYCWPTTGPDAVSGYCNLGNATLTNGSYVDGVTTTTQSGSQTWTFENNDNYLEIPFGGDTLQFRPSTAALEEGILYMHTNGGFFFDEKFEITGSCNGSVTWTSLNNPSNSISFDIENGEDCSSCEEINPVASGCCVLSDGTVIESLTSAACSSLGGVYSGDSSSCPPTGCCTLPDTSVEEDVTEAYCTAQSGSWVSGDCPVIPTGCCELSGQPDESGVTESYCTTQGGTWTEGVDCTTGWCIDNATGLVTSGVEEDECTGTWSATEPAVGCCEISGQANEPNVAQSYCIAQGGTWNEGEGCGTGWCINNTTGAVTAGVEEDECTGTWSASEPTLGCCTISGTQNPDVAESWCTSQSGSFTAGDCVSTEFDPTVSSRIVVNSATIDVPDPSMSCNDNFELNLTLPRTGAYTTSLTKTRGLSGKVTGGDYEYSDPTFGTNISGSRVDVIFDDVAGTYYVKMIINWSYFGSNFGLEATTTPAAISTIGYCPSFVLSGMFDSIVNGSGKVAWTQNCGSKDVTDMIGSYNITVECQ